MTRFSEAGGISMTDGEKMLQLAKTRIGEKYVNVCVPKNNRNWHGPWDCAEFMSWLVYQVGGFLYGCVDDKANPATVEAYTGAWKTDSERLGKRIPWQQAASTVGAVLLRYPPGPGMMGHIVVCDGKGGTVEAMGTAYGVRAGKVSGRHWDTGVLLPNFTYGEAGDELELAEPTKLYAIGRPDMKASVIKDIQRALRDLGFNPGPINGEYNDLTVAAVAAFQATKGLIVDGQVGPQTAKRLKIDL
ncbi:peptidoglycan-binding protein [Bradyrhizobium sp. 81013]|nr:peptidoglycan-binding protein [Bradyrhizobium aeschynomenes]